MIKIMYGQKSLQSTSYWKKGGTAKYLETVPMYYYAQ